MKNVRLALIGVALVATTAVITSQVVSQDTAPKTATKPAQDDHEKMMQQWLKYSAPSEHHQKLSTLAGNWTINVKHWHDPASAPEISSGTAEMKWVLGNRFLEMHVVSEAMGQPFEGMGVLGYDNFRKQYVTGWVDSMNTAVFTSKGSVDATGKVFTFTGTCDDIMTGRRDVNHRAVMTIVSNDKITEEMFAPGADGKEFKAMEITYERSR
jgi:hypothetical protein